MLSTTLTPLRMIFDKLLVEYQFVEFLYVLCIERWDGALFRGLGCWDSVGVNFVWLLVVVFSCRVCLGFVFDVWGGVVFCRLWVLRIVLLDWCGWLLWLWSGGIRLCGVAVVWIRLWWVCLLYCYDVCVICVCVRFIDLCALFFSRFVGCFDSIDYVVDVSFGFLGICS